MKCETTNAVLTFIFCVLAVLGVIFALRTIFLTREFRSLQVQVTQAQAVMARVQQLQSVANDAIAYNQKNPDPQLARIIQAAETKPVAK